jgi:hypothetical protein
MLLKGVQVADTIPDELGPDQLAAGEPDVAVGGEDAIAKEGFPLRMEGLALAVVVELRGQDSLNVLWIYGEDNSLHNDLRLDRVAIALDEVASPHFHIFIDPGRLYDPVDEVHAYICLESVNSTFNARLCGDLF